MLFWTFEGSLEQNMDTERWPWGCTPNCKAQWLQEEGTSHNIFYWKGMMLQEPCKAGKGIIKAETAGFQNTEQILQISSTASDMHAIKLFNDNKPAHELPHLRKSLSECKLSFHSAFRYTMFQCLGPIPKEDNKCAFEQWILKLNKCIAAQGAYFLKWVKGSLSYWSHSFRKYPKFIVNWWTSKGCVKMLIQP